MLSTIEEKLKAEEINPYIELKTSERGEYVAKGEVVKKVGTEDNPVRIAIMPSASHPPHVVHIMMGLKVIADYGVDRVVFSPTGADDRKPHLDPTKSDRYEMTKEVLSIFEPLITFTDVGDLTEEEMRYM